MRLRLLALALLAPATALAADFSYDPPGQLVPGSGEGRVDFNVYAPGIRFPIQDGPAYANSQVWGIGGLNGPPGDWCDPANFEYPWRDNYCETRTWAMPLCPAGEGHQGQDIRASTCEKDVHPAVAVTDGTITSIGSYTVYLTAADGTRFDYLHLDSVAVSVGDEVVRGQFLGNVSNNFGGTATTVHLHYNIQQDVDPSGLVFVPPYLSLVEAYQSLVGPPVPAGSLDGVSCAVGARGWVWDPGAPDVAASVRLAFDGEPGEPGVPVGAFVADDPRTDLCDAIQSCDHGFELALPYSLFDGKAHEVHAHGETGALPGSPASMSCAPPALEGVRRRVSAAALIGWGFDPFWDEPPSDPDAVAALAEDAALATEPKLVQQGAALWLVDRGARRSVNAAAAQAWRLNVGGPTIATPDELALPEGPPLAARPMLARDGSGALWLIDAPPGSPGTGSPAGCGCRAAPAGAGSALWLAGAALLFARRRRVSHTLAFGGAGRVRYSSDRR